MSQAIVDPEELERFAKLLKQFDSELTNRMSALKGQFGHLGSTWRDQEHARFAEDFTQAMRVLSNFIREAEEHVPILLKKAQHIRNYQGR
jgi:uncharacterized protein YukE